MVFTVGDQHQDPVFPGALVQGIQGYPQGLPQVRSLDRHHFRLHGVQEHGRRGIVGGEGALNEGVTCKGHQADPVAIQAAE